MSDPHGVTNVASALRYLRGCDEMDHPTPQRYFDMIEAALAPSAITDPRICPGVHPDGSWTLHPDAQVHPHPHDFGGDRRYTICFLCGKDKEELREDLRDWRYESLIARLAEVLERIAAKL